MGMKIKDSNVHNSDNSKLSADKKTYAFKTMKRCLTSVLENPLLLSLIVLTIAALITRLSYLDMLPGTSWDEVHFGGFANKYINRTFYHDVHPPLGKILIAGAAYVTGYRATFNFSEGILYDDTIRYQLIRSELATVGALIVPVSFLTVYELTHSVAASSLAGVAVLCDTFVHKINSLILLDPLLNLTICLCVFCTFRFHGFRDREFSDVWWRWLTFTGVSLGLVMSIKYIGVFTVLYVGLHTAYQLYLIACDRQKSFWYIIPHTVARVLCLIVVPIIIYLAGFALHMAILTETTPNSGPWLHSRFYGTLNNTEFQNKTFPKYVNYGSNITIQSSSLHSGYLESWFDLFPSELTSPCQVVSTMTIRDPDATDWMIRRIDIENGTLYEGTAPTDPPVLVRNGDWVMLTHMGSDRSLRSHNRRAPFTRKLFQVCTYGDDRAGGPFETWQIVIPGAPQGEPLQVFAHDFKLKHFKMGCYLSASDVALPKAWASEGSKEVACSRNPNYPTLLWHINWINSTKLVGETTLQEHGMPLWERVMQLHKIMFNLNAGLVKDDGKVSNTIDVSDSRPWMWPVAYQMQLMAGYQENPGGESIDFFAVATLNPMVAYANLCCLVSLLCLALYHWYKVLRDDDELPAVLRRREKTLSACLWLVLCWALHYIPFFFMNRILYMHHYCPAFIFSCMITGVILNHACDVASESVKNRCSKTPVMKNHLVLIPVLVFISSYVCLYPLATFVRGAPFSTETSPNYFLDKLHFGQMWVEFGFYESFRHRRWNTYLRDEILDYDESPDLNITLYYETSLNTTRPNSVLKGEIDPVAASNFSSWVAPSRKDGGNFTASDIAQINEDNIGKEDIVSMDAYNESNREDTGAGYETSGGTDHTKTSSVEDNDNTV